MPSVYNKGNILYISWYDPITGERKNKSTRLDDTRANRRIAKDIARQLESKIETEQRKRKDMHIKRITIGSAFEHFLRNNSGKHPKTVKDYNRFYNKFKEKFGENSPCGIISKLSVEDWLIELKRLPQQRNSIFGYYKQLNHFLNFLFEYNYLPMFKINRDVKPKPEIKDKIIFQDEDIETIFENLKGKTSNFRTFIYMAFYTGLRTSDLLSIQVEKMDLEKRQFHYYSPKRKKYRMVPYHEDIQEVITERIKEVGSGLLFNYNCIENVSRAVNRYFGKINLGGKGYTPRTFRKTFITLCRSYGMDASIVAELVGHEHQSTADRFYNRITLQLMAGDLKKFKRPQTDKQK